MQTKQLDGILLSALFESGYRNLKKNVDTINDLNVFPVPDGDTGTNMAKTFGGGLRGVKGESENLGQYMQELSHAVLLSARGNSGVILSQFIFGIAQGFSGISSASIDDLAHAFRCATDAAYKAIITPTEGTMLTVIREGAEFLESNVGKFDCLEDCLSALIHQMKVTLAKTPEMLPVLKEANVVDSGGAGMVCIFEGMYAHLCGETIDDIPDFLEPNLSVGASSFGPDSQLEYGYCTEFILQLMNYKTDIPNFDKEQFIEPLKEMGDSLVAVCNGDIVKIHIHTFTPEKVLEYGRKFGEFVTLKIENMSVQHSEIEQGAAEPEKEHLKYAVVAVASGDGIVEYFESIGANVVINGGQTNNPPVDAFLDAFKKFDAEHIIVLPNNSNVVLTARQAAELYTDSDVRVIPTKSIVEGYSALSMMNLWCDTVDEVIDEMTCGLENVTTASVTTATRDTEMNGIKIQKDNYIGLADKKILSCGDNKVSVAMHLVAAVDGIEEKEVFTVFYGKDVTDAEIDELRARLAENYPLCDVGFVNGKQDVYSFIISLE